MTFDKSWMKDLQLALVCVATVWHKIMEWEWKSEGISLL